MNVKHKYAMPYNAFPRDVTSPGPSQRPGVAKSHATDQAEDRRETPQKPENGDQQPEPPQKQ
jgi:hypothetical protein